MLRPLALAALLGLMLTGALAGCSTPPAEQEAIRKAWAARDAERAPKMSAQRLGISTGGCLRRGP